MGETPRERRNADRQPPLLICPCALSPCLQMHPSPAVPGPCPALPCPALAKQAGTNHQPSNINNNNKIRIKNRLGASNPKRLEEELQPWDGLCTLPTTRFRASHVHVYLGMSMSMSAHFRPAHTVGAMVHLSC